MSDIVPNKQNLIIYNTIDGKVSVTMMARDGNVWMNQKQMAELFATSVPNVNIHISNILKENELDRDSVIKDYLITATDGKHYDVTFYALDMVLAVGFRVKGKRGIRTRMCFATPAVFPRRKWKPAWRLFTGSLISSANNPMRNSPTKWTMKN